MNREETRNLILAIVLSALVLIGWNFVFPPPQPARLPAPTPTPSATATASPPSATVSANPSVGAGAAAAKPETRAEALAESQRVKIDTRSLSGSINLKGGEIDDLTLKDYRETTDPGSPNIVLLSPAGSPAPYWAETGFVSADASVKTPNRASVWTANGPTLTSQSPVTLSFDNGAGLVFRREISVDDKYMFTVKDWVEASAGVDPSVRPYSVILRHGKPPLAGYAALHEGFIGVVGESGVNSQKYSDVEKAADKTIAMRGDGGWLGITDKYWAVVVIPEKSEPIEARFTASGDPTAYDYQVDFTGPDVKADSTATNPVVTHIFAGAKEVSTLDAYESKLDIRIFSYLIDWGWFFFFTKPLFRLMDAIYRLVGNFGLAILSVTVIVKLVFFPLANRSFQSMAKMKKIQPEIAAIKERYPGDATKQQQAQMELFKREGVNPVAGCLPMLIQIPVFFALYKVILVTIEMRQAPFFGWIKDLSAPDPTNVFNLFGLLPFDPSVIPVFGHFLFMGAWPLIMGLSMFLQMKMNPEPTDPAQKAIFTWMPLIFTFTLANFPVGLVIYWTWNNLLSIVQQYFIMRRAGVKFELWDNLARLIGQKPKK